MDQPTLDRIIERLLAETGAGRTTLRVEDPADGGFPIVAEAAAEGVRTLRGGSVGDLRAAATFQALERDRRPLVQDDLTDADPAPPPDLVALYGARAQMLAPLSAPDGHLVGIVSVHEVRGPRPWSESDVAALQRAADELAALVAAAVTGADRG
ncbi:GAF domain-containing protein [Baekduia soli]|uniref:GAF domain-containing protein n=1 Tax=Baekduia soli TaxID=496014 RepID=A0A5B8U5Y4_9ACTN|nr:GAF domain-containing protein [Baekduia soli]QEC48430.1 GAF domain-containing protein [Baekduia soli]